MPLFHKPSGDETVRFKRGSDSRCLHGRYQGLNAVYHDLILYYLSIAYGVPTERLAYPIISPCLISQPINLPVLLTFSEIYYR